MININEECLFNLSCISDMHDPVRNAEMLQTQILQSEWFLLDSHNLRHFQSQQQ